MGLRQEQSVFARKLAVLVSVINECGYQVTFGDVYATSGHTKNSFHYDRLAADLNLFHNGVYLTDTESHRPFGEIWKKMGGTWGGDFKQPDGNHYSWGEGRRT